MTTSTFVYYGAPSSGERPYQMVNKDSVTGKRICNWTEDEHQMEIKNIRETFETERVFGKQATYTLNTSGFQFHRQPTTHQDFTSDTAVKQGYYPECVEMFKKLTGASEVVIFDHTIRRRNPGAPDDSPDKRQPVSLVHVDQTLKSSLARVNLHCSPADVPKRLTQRFQVVNLWRPIEREAWDWPLALCDYRSVDPEKDLIPVALVYPDREGETYGVTYNPNHRWHYLRGMTPDELVLIKCFDSLQDGSVARLTPHTAFCDPTTPEGSPYRSSIEVRAILFYD
ncbi:hypothetical protein CONPUDRAFT_158774 [Coniophora puteana RWD-64-598 SS2]|uniref:Methyltransferase n=1 Tax=Coniophora puteana (strain RWD-64-598) TaxID=741705 RepID=A0A5M3MBI2_CONPW|nr:uncharacterized protein CONPUDRAFT_158774 [Coniophora puteana RWD-64-598 SS2]EIW75995.1 hypothetical protein CONPUDRAFT_158774 [Coniophora puteana RWD-64-598 SS2]